MQEEKIRYALEKLIQKNKDKNINIDEIYINDYCKKPGARGCIFESDAWYTYYVDDRCNTLINGPYTIQGVIAALSVKLFLTDEENEYDFTEEELETFLLGEVPLENFKGRNK